MPREITDIGFDADGVVLVTYLDTADVRCDSAVAVRHTARIVPTGAYQDAIERLERSAHALLNEALQDWQHSQPVQLEELAEEGSRQQRASAADPDEEREREEDEAAARNMRAIEKSRRAAEAAGVARGTPGQGGRAED